MPARQLIIIAAGALAREVACAAPEAEEPWDVVGYLDDDRALHGQILCGVPVLGGIDDWPTYPDAHFVIAIGPPRPRRAVAARMEGLGQPRFGAVIHRSVQKTAYVEVGAGSIVCAGTTMTTQVRLGRHVVVNPGCTLAHDVDLADFTTFGPLVACSGRVTCATGVEVGTGVAIRQGLSIGKGAMVGMGSVVTKNIAPDTLWFGNPASQKRPLEAWGGQDLE